MKSIICALALAIIAALVFGSAALAGGWAIVVLDQLPAQVVAGRPVTISFVVRQHGVTPTNGFEPTIMASSTETREKLNIVPDQRGPVGHFTADVTFPSAGVWHWSVRTVTVDQPMPPLTVLAAAPGQETRAASREPSPSSIVPMSISIVGWVGALLGLFLWRQKGRAPALLLMLVGVAVGVAGLALTTAETPSPAVQAQSSVSVAQLDPVETGKWLFLAKGCVVCHENGAVADLRGSFDSLQVGPDLTRLRLPPDYLKRWLKDPSAVKPGTQMPTLGLSDEEIDALVAFLTQPMQDGNEIGK